MPFEKSLNLDFLDPNHPVLNQVPCISRSGDSTSKGTFLFLALYGLLFFEVLVDKISALESKDAIKRCLPCSLPFCALGAFHVYISIVGEKLSLYDMD